MSSIVEINGSPVTVTGTPGQITLTENFGLFGDQGISVTSLSQLVAFVSAFKAEAPKAWPGVEL